MDGERPGPGARTDPMADYLALDRQRGSCPTIEICGPSTLCQQRAVGHPDCGDIE